MSTDRLLALFTLALAIVGFLQFLALVLQAALFLRSLNLIREQATEMHSQRLIMRDQFQTMQKQVLEMGKQTAVLERSVTVAEKSAFAAAANIKIFKDKERARLRIEVANLSIKEREFLTHAVTSTIFHDGPTNAIYVDGRAEALLSDKQELPRPLAEADWPMTLGQVIKPEDKPIEFQARFHTLGLELSSEQIKAINEGKLFVHFFGHIRFQDVFGDKWVLRFRRRWEFTSMKLPPGMPLFGTWLQYGPDSENSEMRDIQIPSHGPRRY
jgi:hypothetical protein